MDSTDVDDVTKMAEKIMLKKAPHIGAVPRSSSGRVLAAKPQVDTAVWKTGEQGSSLRDVFTEVYKKEIAPWDLEGEPQAVVVGADLLGFFVGRTLDIGCGTGDTAIYLAKKHHGVVGIDISRECIEDAEARRAAQQLDTANNPTFITGDFFKLSEVIPDNNMFDTTYDGGLYHCLNDTEQQAFVNVVTKHTKIGGRFMTFVFSDQNVVTGAWHGPRRLSQDQLRASFNATSGWHVDFIQPVKVTSNPNYVKRTGWTHDLGYFLAATRIIPSQQ